MPSSRVAALTNAVNRILNSTKGFDRTVYLRTITAQVGDALLGRFSSFTTTDTLLNPQPYVERLGRERVPGGHANAETMLVGGSMKVGDDYQVLVSASALSLAQLQNPQNQIVFKDSSGNLETLSIHDFETAGLDGSDVVYNVFCRSVKVT